MRHHGAYDPPEYAGSGQPTRRAAQRLRELPARVSPLRAAKHALAAALQTEHGLSERRASEAGGLRGWICHYADGSIVNLGQ